MRGLAILGEIYPVVAVAVLSPVPSLAEPVEVVEVVVSIGFNSADCF